MDFRKFGAFVLAIGLLVALYGVIQIAANQPVKEKRSSEGGLMDALSEMGSAITSFAENADRQHRRNAAVKVIFAGAVVALLGIGLRYSARQGP